MQRLTLLLLRILWPSLGLLVRHRSSLNVVSGPYMRRAMVEVPHVVIVTVLSSTLRYFWLSRHHRCCRCCSSHGCLWSSIARTLMAMILLRKLRGRCVLEGTLVVQSLRVDIDPRSRLVLNSIGDSIFAVVWPFLSGWWLRILICRGFGLWHMNVGAGTGNVEGILMIDTRWVRSWVRYLLGRWLCSRSGYGGNPDALQKIRSRVVLLDRYIRSVMGLCFGRRFTEIVPQLVRLVDVDLDLRRVSEGFARVELLPAEIAVRVTERIVWFGIIVVCRIFGCSSRFARQLRGQRLGIL